MVSEIKIKLSNFRYKLLPFKSHNFRFSIRDIIGDTSNLCTKIYLKNQLSVTWAQFEPLEQLRNHPSVFYKLLESYIPKLLTASYQKIRKQY